MNKELFWVRTKDDPRVVKVYGVTDDSNGYPKFLVRENNQWKWRSAKYYQPMD